MEDYWGALVAVVALTLTGVFGVVWSFRARAVQRWLTVLDAFAQREIAGTGVSKR